MFHIQIYNSIHIALYTWRVYVFDGIIRFSREPLAEDDWWTYSVAYYHIRIYTFFMFYRHGDRRPTDSHPKNVWKTVIGLDLHIMYINYNDNQMTLRRFEPLSRSYPLPTHIIYMQTYYMLYIGMFLYIIDRFSVYINIQGVSRISDILWNNFCCFQCLKKFFFFIL